MKLEKLIEKFRYIQVRNKYEVIKVHHLLQKIGEEIFSSDEGLIKFLNKKEFCDHNYFLMKREDGSWGTQSHLLTSDNYIEELEEEIDFYLRKLNREALTDEEREEGENKIYSFGKDFDSFMCFISDNYTDEEDLEHLGNVFEEAYKTVSNKYELKYHEFILKEDYEEKIMSFLRNKKIRDRNDSINSIL